MQAVLVRNRQHRLNVGSNTPSMENILFIIFCRLLVSLKTSSHICELNLWISDRVVMVSPGDSVLAATKKMVQAHSSSAVVAVGNKAQGILT